MRVWITHGHPEGKGMRWDKVDLRNLDLLQAGIVFFSNKDKTLQNPLLVFMLNERSRRNACPGALWWWDFQGKHQETWGRKRGIEKGKRRDEGQIW